MLLEFDRVCFRYSGLGQVDSQNQLQEISFRFESHEALGIVGQGGAGKTTLLQMITGLEKPNSGRVCVDQQNIHQKKYPLAQLRQKIGLVFQFPESQLFEMTVREDVAYGPRNLGLSADTIEQRVQAALEQMELPAEQFQNRDIHHLSQGKNAGSPLPAFLRCSRKCWFWMNLPPGWIHMRLANLSLSSENCEPVASTA